MDKKPTDWRRIGKWAFWITNLIGVIIAIPLLSAVWPLMNVYWNTRSESAVAANATFQTNASLALPTAPENAAPPPEPAEVPPSPETHSAFEEIEAQLDQVPDLNQESIEDIIARHFGPTPDPPPDPESFDEESAVFEDIDKVIREIDGTRYHIYLLKMKDRNGNRVTRPAAFEQPNADYERSLQTMKLVQGNPQLKSIYNAFSHVLAQMAEEQESVADDGENIEAELSPEQVEDVLSDPQ